MTEPLRVDGRWESSESGHRSFQSCDPCTGVHHPELFPVSSWRDLERMAEAASVAARELRTVDPLRIGRFLEHFADLIERDAERITTTAASETGLPAETRLLGIELPRTTAQLRAAAEAARDCTQASWRQPRIDEASNIRSILEPLGGAVLVIGPNNFPLAFNAISGGDFAAAIAAGNPVISKGHPAHPMTTLLLARCAVEALEESGLPAATVQCFFDADHEDIHRLIEHPAVSSVAFTGSERAGLSIKTIADRSGTLCSLEMSSLNPVVVFPDLGDDEIESFIEQWSGSILMGSGQFCTKPGVAFVIGDEELGRRITEGMTRRLSSIDPPVMLAESLLDALDAGIRIQQEAGAELICGGSRSPADGFRYSPTLLLTNGQSFLEMPVSYQRELFGPAALLVLCNDSAQLERVLGTLSGQLTCCMWTGADSVDERLRASITDRLRPLCGRLLENKMPTGVAVVDAMVHGGPYPATSHPGFTAVGLPESLRRFAARRCYDGLRESALPSMLRT
ncbi:MAG: aldehyde dehydrogenase family protein [Planctomycetota bacterium]|nr:aldehyde dehydrogenase family protein [Planctomycetota bacterium]